MPSVTRFGLFEADIPVGELRKQGRIVRLQQQPFELLKALLARPGEIVTREDIRQQLWPSSVVADFDQSLNKSVTKLRDALGDSAASPRFIETIHKRGYRFIAPVTVLEMAQPNNVPVLPPVSTAPITLAAVPPVRTSPAFTLRTQIPLALMAGLVVLLLNFTGAMRRPAQLVTQPAPRLSTSPADTLDGGANEAYGRGRIALSRRTEDGLRSGVTLFQRALALDPGFASAYVGLSDAWSLLASHGMEEPGPAIQRAREFAERALALSPADADAHASMGRLTMIGDWDWSRAEAHFQRSLGIREASATPHRWYAYLLSATGRHAEADREARRAAEIEPDSLNAATGVGYVLYAARRFDDAAVELRRVIEVDPDFIQARRNLGLVLAMQGRNREATAEFERIMRLSGDSVIAQADLAWIRGRSGDVAGARRLLTALQARGKKHYVTPDALALALIGAGQVDAAVHALQQAFDARVATMAHFAVDPIWDSLRDVPRARVLADAVTAGGTGNNGMVTGRPRSRQPSIPPQ